MGAFLLPACSQSVEVSGGRDDTALADTAETGTLDTSETGETGLGDDTGGTTPTDPDLVSPTSPLYGVFDAYNLKALSGGDNADFDLAVDTYLATTMAALTATTANSSGNYKTTLFGDIATRSRNGTTNHAAYLAITADYTDVMAAAAADTMIDGAEMDPDLGLKVPYMLVGGNIITNDSDGSVVSAGFVITNYGTNTDANSSYTLLYSGIEQQVTIINNYTQEKVTFTDAAELASAESAAVSLLGAMTFDGDGAPQVDQFTIEGDEF